jgi:hypothetical protein
MKGKLTLSLTCLEGKMGELGEKSDDDANS